MLKIQIPIKVDSRLRNLPVCAVDLGYSNRRRTCGFATGADDNPHDNIFFGELVGKLRNWITSCNGTECVIILEAPLSQHFQQRVENEKEFWNPAMRAFESGRLYDKLPQLEKKYCPWYSGPGAGVALAALNLLRSLSDLDDDKTVHLFEGFHPRWLTKAKGEESEDWSDYDVARRLIEGFRDKPSRVIQITVTTPGFSHWGNAANASGLNVLPEHRNRSPMLVFASQTLFDNRPH